MFRRYKSSVMLALGFATIGLLIVSPDALPPAAVAGLLIISFALLLSGMRGRRNSHLA